MNLPSITFNLPNLVGSEIDNINEAYERGQLSGDGYFAKKSHEILTELCKVKKVLLTHSCTGALEMSAILAGIKPGDEVIMPSFTFVSTANAFVINGAIPVFVDVKKDTLNLNENLIRNAITAKTKAIVPVHYAGVSCEMDKIFDIAKRHNLFVIEDSAQGIMASYKGRPLGSMGDFGCLSFHETKNIHCGEGGALLINNEKYIERAEIIREKGTNRSKFFRGQVDKYGWEDVGSSYLLGELSAAFLAAQLEEADNITKERIKIWNMYHEIFCDLEENELVRRPIITNGCKHNGHIYYLLLNRKFSRDTVLKKLKAKGVNAVFHYQPLHSSPAGLKYGKTPHPLEITDDISERLIRLPMWIGFDQHERVKYALQSVLM